MKRLLFKMFMLAAVLTSLQANAAMYIVGSEPFGDWDVSAGVQMTDNGDGTYSYTTRISTRIWFVFADGLAPQYDWDTFNDYYRIGPTDGSDQEVEMDTWITAYKPSNDNAYSFTGNGSEYVITFDKTNMRFKISGGSLYAFEMDGIYYNITGPYTVEVTKGSKYGMDYSGEVTIPSSVTFEGVTYQVTAIGEDAFQSCHDLTWVNIPATVTDIKKAAFYYCTSLTKVELPESVRTIGDWNFYCSSELTTVVLPSTLLYLNDQCFGSCPKLTKVTCKATTPPSLSTGCFGNNPTDHTLYVPADAVSDYQADTGWNSRFGTIRAMLDYDFEYMNLKFVITGSNTAKVVGPAISSPSGSWSIPDIAPYNGVNYIINEIADWAFYNCEYITAMAIGPNVKVVGAYAFYNCTGISILKLGSVTTILDVAFGNTSALTSVTLPGTLTHLGSYAFDCSGLTSVTIPASVQTILENPFHGCASLTAINVDSANEYYTSVVGVLFNKSMTKLIGYPLGNGATSYTVPDGVEIIDRLSIGYSLLHSVTLPSSVTHVDYLAFAYCPELTSVTSLALAPPEAQEFAFVATLDNSGLTLYVPKGRRNAYQAADIWKDFPTIREVTYDFMVDGIYYNITNSDAKTVEVTYSSSDYNSYSGAVDIPETVTYNGVTYTVTGIGDNAFRMSKSLTSVTIPNTVTTIGNYAFHYCEELSDVVIPNSVTTIGACAFWLCMHLYEAVIPNSVTTVGDMAFRNCTAMTRVVIGENVSSIGTTCFYYDPNITEIICLAATPPAIDESGDQTTFMPAIYQNVALKVPYGSHDAYRNDAGWGGFSNFFSVQDVEPYLTGDVNGDGELDINDVTILIDVLLYGSQPPAAADVNGDSETDINDVTFLIDMLLAGTSGGTTGPARSDYLFNGMPFTMVKVDGGVFMMGIEGDNSASPVHEVTLSGYYNIGQTEVTQALWQTIMGNNPSHNNTGEGNLPVENIEWDDCQTFVTKLSKLTGLNFRLPTEAEWEFAARGGNKSKGYIYAGSNNLGDVAWYAGNSGNKSHVVATKEPNELGLYDMSGNVFEWCQDYWANYENWAVTDPMGPPDGEYRVCRSSAFNRSNNNNWFKCGGRTFDSPESAAYDTGMRLAVDNKRRGDVNYDGVVDENDYATLWAIYQGQYPLSTFTADVNADGSIIFDYNSNILTSDNTALVRILYHDLMKTWYGYPFNDLIAEQYNEKYDINYDGEVNIADFNASIENAIDGINYSYADLDRDGQCTWRDVCIFHVAWMKMQGLW